MLSALLSLAVPVSLLVVLAVAAPLNDNDAPLPPVPRKGCGLDLPMFHHYSAAEEPEVTAAANRRRSTLADNRYKVAKYDPQPSTPYCARNGGIGNIFGTGTSECYIQRVINLYSDVSAKNE
jgi:hypothetical protein